VKKCMCWCLSIIELKMHSKTLKLLLLNFVFMGPCNLVYNDHINTRGDAVFYALMLYDKCITLLNVSYPKRGTTTQNTAHSVNDLDTPIHTGTQLEKSSPSPKINKNPRDLQSTIQD